MIYNLQYVFNEHLLSFLNRMINNLNAIILISSFKKTQNKSLYQPDGVVVMNKSVSESLRNGANDRGEQQG